MRQLKCAQHNKRREEIKKSATKLQFVALELFVFVVAFKLQVVCVCVSFTCCIHDTNQPHDLWPFQAANEKRRERYTVLR